MTVPVASYEMNIVEGATYSIFVEYADDNGDPIDVSGYTASLKIGSSTAVALELTVGSGITVAAEGFTITITAAQTEDIETSKFDFDITSPSSVVTRLMSGPVKLYRRKVRD